jgi:hypothetical protein
MHITLVLIAAAGQVVTAFDPHVTHLPRAANQDDNLATITTLVDGHLPTCFTGHPTYPCPTNGPGAKRDMVEDLAGNPVGGLAGNPVEGLGNPMGSLGGNPMGGLPGGLNEVAHIVPIPQVDLVASGEPSLPTDAPRARVGPVGPRDAPMEAWDKDYIPHPNEWAIPGSFKFTDSIDHNSTGHKYNGHSSAGQKYIAHEPAAHKYTGHNSTAQKYAGHEAVAHKYTGYQAIAHKHTGQQHSGYDSTAHKHTGYNSTAYKYTGYNSTGSTPSAVNLTTASVEKYYVAPTGVIPQSNDHLDHYNNQYAHHHNKIHHTGLGHGNNYNHTSAIAESVAAKAYSQTTDAPVLPSASHTSVANSSREVEVAASIGTLLSAAMYPGTMRKPSTTQIQQASISTSCTSSEASSSSITTPMYDVPVTMATSASSVALSEARPTASYKVAKAAQHQHTARHFVS